jgi:hypothetical protein
MMIEVVNIDYSGQMSGPKYQAEIENWEHFANVPAED